MTEFLKSRKGRVIVIAAAIVLIAAVIVIILLSAGGETGYRNISVSRISGVVMAENNGNEYEAYENMRLADGYALTTGVDSYSRLVLDEDKYMKLEQGSRAEFRNVGDAKNHITSIYLAYGALTAELVNPLKEEESFVVNTPNAVLAVRGTFYRVEVSYDINGDAYTDVYTYGGAIACHRIMPDGTEVDEEVMVNQGYKARIKMDEIITIYVEELIEYEPGDDVDPLSVNEISDDDIVDIYNASYHGHTMFLSTKELWQEILDRDIDIEEYYSPYDMGEIEPYIESDENESGENTSADSTDGAHTDTSETTAAADTSDTEDTSQSSDTETADTVEIAPDVTTTGTSGYGSTVVPPGGTAPDYEESPETSDSAASQTGVSAAATEETSESSSVTVSEVTSASAETASGNSTTVTVPGESSMPGGTTTESTTPDTIPEESSTPEESTAESTTPDTIPEESSTPEESTTESTTPDTVPEESSEPDSGSEPEEPGHVHIWGEYVSDNNATCTEDGTKTAKCTECDEENTIADEGTALGHIEAEEVIEPTFASEGLRRLYCRRCGETLHKEVLDKINALYTEDGRITITQTGYIQGDGEEIAYTGDYVIRQREYDTAVEEFSLTVESGTHNVTIDGVNVHDKIGNGTENSIFYVGTEASVILQCTEKDNILVSDNCSYGIYNSGELIFNSGTIMSSARYYLLLNEGTLVINDGTISSDEGIENRGIAEINGGLTAINFIGNYDSFVINEGSIQLNCTSDGIYNGGEFEINGGSVEIYYSREGIYHFGISNNGKFKITDGTVKIDGNIDTGISNISMTEDTEFLVSGGSIYIYGDCGIENSSRLFEVSGGTIEIKGIEGGITNEGIFNHSTYYYDSTFLVTGGSIEIKNTDDLGISNSAKFEITAGTVTVDGEGAINNDGDISITEGALICPDSIIYSTSNGTFTIDAGTFSIGNISNIGIFTVNGGTVTSTYGIGSSYGEFNITGGTVITNKEISCRDDCVFTISGGSVTAESVNADVWFDSTPIIVIGGSLRVTEEPLEGWITDVYGNWLTCTVYDEYPGNIPVTLPDGTSYIYTLAPEDAAEDGKYYVWLPVVEVEPDGIAIDDVNFPDPVFRDYVSENFDLDDDGYLSEEECEAVTDIDVSGTDSDDGGITSLEGIEYFTELSALYCTYNEGLDSLDVSNNTALTTLQCNNTGITELDVSGNIALANLNFSRTGITAIDVSNNTALMSLYCSNTGITSIDIRNNTALSSFSCANTRITSLDLSNKPHLIFLYCYNCNLPYIDISETYVIFTDRFNAYDNVYPIPSNATEFDTRTDPNFAGFNSSNVSNVKNATFSNGVFSNIKGDITYTYNCGGMGALSETFTLARTGEPVAMTVEINDENFPDEGFRNYVKSNFDKDSNGILSVEEINNATRVDISYYNYAITDLKGIEYFVALTYLDCQNLELDELDVSRNTALTDLQCYNAGITALDVSNNTALTVLDCSYTGITELDVSNNTALTYLNCSDTEITALNVSNNTALTYLNCDSTGITSLDVNKNTALADLNCSGTEITALDVSNNTALTDLHCTDTAGIAELDVSNNTALTNLYCSDTGITKLDVSNNTALRTLWCYNTGITELDVSNNTALRTLYCSGTGITELDVRNNTALTDLYCFDTGITELDVSNNNALTYLHCSGCSLAYVDISNNPSISIFGAGGNIHPITVGADRTFDISTDPAFDGIDCDKISITDGSTVLVIGQSAHFSNIQGDITYDYDCGQEKTVSFTLKVTFTDSYSLTANTTNQPLDPLSPDLTEGQELSGTDPDTPDPPESLVPDEGQTDPDTDDSADLIEDAEGDPLDSGDVPIDEILALARGRPP